MLSPNTILQDRYRIVRELGHGGMGYVYEAIDQRVNCIVAIKETIASDNAESRRAFEREAALLANLRHRGLPKVMDYFSENDGDFLVMEFIPGHDLAELLDLRGSPFPQSDVLRWAAELLSILVYLHGQQPPILHRDIKPSNVKLTKEGDLFLLDFGLAKGALGQMPTMVTSRSVRGYTPVYAPLEQILSQGTDPRSDLYSVGATLYHLLTGVPPVDAPSRFHAIEDERPDPLKRVDDLNPTVATDAASIVQQVMSVSRKQRPASATELRLALKDVAEGIDRQENAKRAEEERRQREETEAAQGAEAEREAARRRAAEEAERSAREEAGAEAKTRADERSRTPALPSTVFVPTELPAKQPDKSDRSPPAVSTILAPLPGILDSATNRAHSATAQADAVPTSGASTSHPRYRLWALGIAAAAIIAISAGVGVIYFVNKLSTPANPKDQIAVKLDEPRRLAAAIKWGDMSPERIPKARRAIAAYEAVYHVGLGSEVDDEAFKEIARLYDNIQADDELTRWVHQRAASEKESNKDRAEAYTYLAAMQWRCADEITEAHSYLAKNGDLSYRKPEYDNDLSKLRGCVEQGYSNIERALELNSDLAIAWTYKALLMLTVAALDEMEGNNNFAQNHKDISAEASKRAFNLRQSQPQNPDSFIPEPGSNRSKKSEPKPAQ